MSALATAGTISIVPGEEDEITLRSNFEAFQSVDNDPDEDGGGVDDGESDEVPVDDSVDDDDEVSGLDDFNEEDFDDDFDDDFEEEIEDEEFADEDEFDLGIDIS